MIGMLYNLYKDERQWQSGQGGVASSIALMELFHSAISVPSHQSSIGHLLLSQLLYMPEKLLIIVKNLWQGESRGSMPPIARQSNPRGLPLPQWAAPSNSLQECCLLQLKALNRWSSIPEGI